MTCREWLGQNNYEDVLSLIDNAMAKMTARGSKQRRNWWEVLAGGVNGRPFQVEGIEFPILTAAQLHQGVQVTPNAICRNPNEQPPPPRKTGRWPRKKRGQKRRPAQIKNL